MTTFNLGNATPAFFSQYAMMIDFSDIKGSWNISGPQTLEMIPEQVRALFDDPLVEQVAVKRGEGGYVITRRS